MKEQIKKKNILNLIKYYSENNDAGFRAEAYDIARYFNSIGDTQLAEYIMAIMSGTNTFTPQEHNDDMPYFMNVSLSAVSPLPLPVAIKDDVVGVINSIRHGVGVHKFLFEGAPGTGKTETAKQIARILERSLHMIDFDSLISSRLGETQKNISAVFEELRSLPKPERIIILVDEIDAIALDRINSRDVREMGRVTSSFLKGMDGLDERIVLIATTNLYEQFDKALSRRFDAVINFNRYSKEDLIDVGEAILSHLLVKFRSAGRNMRLFRKILALSDDVPYPGNLKNIIKTSLAFSDPSSEYDYLRKIYETLNGTRQGELDIKKLKKEGYTVRETEVLTGMSKSQVARELSA
jgi:Cdc6-like AAA superfamily ATPase